jgi:hypothetical protein
VKEKAKEGPKEMFRLTDQLRDEILPCYGILIEDRKPGDASMWKFVKKETLIKEMKAKAELKAEKIKAFAVKKALEDKIKSTPPSQWF